LLSQMARDAVAPGFEYHQCVAVSTTPDPVSDPWFLYDFQVITPSADLYTAPRLAVWMDGYYLALDQWKYNPSTGGWNAAGQGAAVLEREKMLLGQNARMIYFNLANSHPQLRYMVPADLDGFPPPLDTPGLFLQVDDTDRGATADQLEIWQLDVTWDTELAAWGKAKDLAVDTFDSKFTCSPTSYDCIPQPGATTDQYLDAVAERLMYRVQYRYMNDAGHLILNHTVDAGSGRAGVRWYHLQTDALQEWTVADQGTYAPPDVHHRWMGSAAMDASGNIAVGYSVASSTLFPSIRYTGRLSTDTPGTIPITERGIINGGGSQTNTDGRWGDYSAMSADPSTPGKFWYTQEYYSSTSAANWKTRIGSFSFSNVFSTVASAAPNPVCLGDSTQLMVLANGGSGSGYTYSWTSIPAGFTSNIYNPKVLPSEPTKYIAHTSDGAITRHDTIDVTLGYKPIVEAGSDTIVCWYVIEVPCSGSISNYKQFAWSTTGGGSFTNTATLSTIYRPSLSDKLAGFVDLKQVASSNAPCTGNVTDIRRVTFDVCTGLETPGKDGEPGILIQPNPASTSVMIGVRGRLEGTSVLTVKTIDGKTLFTENITGRETPARNTLDISGYARGIYIVQLLTGNKVVNEKMVIQ